MSDDVTVVVYMPSGHSRMFENVWSFSVREDGIVEVVSRHYGLVASFVPGAWTSVEIVTSPVSNKPGEA